MGSFVVTNFRAVLSLSMMEGFATIVSWLLAAKDVSKPTILDVWGGRGGVPDCASEYDNSDKHYLQQSMQEWTKLKLWKTAFKKLEATWSA